MELSNQRDYGSCGPRPIKPTEIQAWSSLTNRHPSPREVRIILDLDIRFRKIHSEDESEYGKLSDEEKQVLQFVNAARSMSRKV